MTKQSIQKLNFNVLLRTIIIEMIGGAQIELKLAEQEGFDCLKQKLDKIQESGKFFTVKNTFQKLILVKLY